MKLLSWNVNGYRAVSQKTFPQWLADSGADAVCLQETKASPDQLTDADLNPGGYLGVWNASTVKKGYSGTATLLKTPPLSVSLGLPDERFRGEGRLVCTEHPGFYLFNVYFPNSGRGDDRLAFKMGFYDVFLAHAQALRSHKPIVLCGDLNTAHTPLDIHDPARNAHSPGFLPQEREWMDRLVAAGYVDTFRLFTAEGGHYTWWDYLTKARERNAGWRIDYFFVSEELRPRVRRAWIEAEVTGSDHCPVGLELDMG